jgi:hypothetical protein
VKPKRSPHSLVLSPSSTESSVGTVMGHPSPSSQGAISGYPVGGLSSHLPSNTSHARSQGRLSGELGLVTPTGSNETVSLFTGAIPGDAC